MPDDDRSGRVGPGFYDENWFTQGCQLATRIMVKERGKRKKKYDENREYEFEKARKVFEKAKDAFREAKRKYPKDDERYWDEESRFNLAQEKFSGAKLKYEKHEVNYSLKYLRYNVEPYQVRVFSQFSIIVVFLALLFLDFILFFGLSLLGFFLADILIIFMAVVTFLAPIVAASVILRYPMTKAKKVQINTLGRLPETINYMSMSMYLNPSLNTAIEFAANNVEEPLSTNLRKILWNVYIRRFDSIEESFLDFGIFCGEFSEEFKRALYNIRNAAIEKTVEGIHRALDTANEIILEGTKRQMERFANSLTAPTMILFSIGIMLPMIIGAMLPLLRMGEEALPLIIVLMDIVFPGATFLYSFHILGSRPGTSVPPRIPNPLSHRKRLMIVIGSFVMFIAGLLAGLLWMNSLTSDADPLMCILSPLPIIWGAGLGIVYFCRATSRHQKRKRETVLKMEEEFPDALYHLGSRIAEGKSFEEALRTTAKTMEGSHIGRLYSQMFYNLQVVRSTLKDALFGQIGILHDMPSRTIQATMGTVIESVKKDASTAGATIIKISRYLRDLKSMEKEIDNKLSGVRSMMLTTGSIFGPLIMGITTALYLMLTDSLSGIEPFMGNDTAEIAGIGGFGGGFGGQVAISPEIFSLVIGIYLLLTVLIIIYFCTNLKYGDDRVELKVAFANVIPVTLIIYTVTIIAANLILL